MSITNGGDTLRIAIPNKGSLSQSASDMLREAGYKQRTDSKQLTLTDTDNAVEFFYLRPRDIAVYVGEGTLDLGVTGTDLLIDSGTDAVPVLPLGFGASTFRLAAFPGTIGSLRDLEGKTVAVIGTGASAIQFVPKIQPKVEKLHLFQRTPAWVAPRGTHPAPRGELGQRRRARATPYHPRSRRYRWGRGWRGWRRAVPAPPGHRARGERAPVPGRGAGRRAARAAAHGSRRRRAGAVGRARGRGARHALP